MLRLAPLRLLILVRVPNAFPSFLRLGLLPGKALVLMDTQFHPVLASVSGRRQHCCFGSSMRADAAAPASLLEFRTPFHQLECCVGTHVCVTRPCPYGSMEAWMRGLPNLPVPLHPNSGRNLVEEQSMYLMHWSIAVNVPTHWGPCRKVCRTFAYVFLFIGSIHACSQLCICLCTDVLARTGM